MVYKGRLKKSQTWDIVPNSVPTPPEDRVSLRGNFLAGFLRLVKDAFRIKKIYFGTLSQSCLMLFGTYKISCHTFNKNKLGVSWAKLSPSWGLKLEFGVEV